MGVVQKWVRDLLRGRRDSLMVRLANNAMQHTDWPLHQDAAILGTKEWIAWCNSHIFCTDSTSQRAIYQPLTSTGSSCQGSPVSRESFAFSRLAPHVYLVYILYIDILKATKSIFLPQYTLAAQQHQEKHLCQQIISSFASPLCLFASTCYHLPLLPMVKAVSSWL